MTSLGAVHKLIVHKVGDDDEFHTAEFEDYEIEHPAECPTREVGNDATDAPAYTDYDCGVQFNVDNVVVRYSLRYSGTPVTEPGEYQIQAWAETIRGFDYTEHDGGIGLVIE